jgi:hypothetical protein
VLIDLLKNQIGDKFNCTLQPLNDETISRYRNDFYNPIYRRQEVIQATRSARADFKVRIPLIYTLSFTGRGLVRQPVVRDVVTLVFFDTAGEDLDNEDTVRTENKYIWHSSGIVLLLDPLQIPAVRLKLPNGTPLPNENTESSEILARMINLIRKAKRLKPNELIDIPIAVVFAKIDSLSPILDPSSCLQYPSKHVDHFDIADFKDVNWEMETLESEWNGTELNNQLKANFSRYAFFGLTALGCNPHLSQKIPKLRPRRVEDPFLWLLWHHNLINAK